MDHPRPGLDEGGSVFGVLFVDSVSPMGAESSRLTDARSFLASGVFSFGIGAFAPPLPGVKDLAAPMLSTPPSVVGRVPSPLELVLAMLQCSCEVGGRQTEN